MFSPPIEPPVADKLMWTEHGIAATFGVRRNYEQVYHYSWKKFWRDTGVANPLRKKYRQ